MAAQQPIQLPEGKMLQVNDMQAGVISPQEAIAFGNPRASEGLEEARGFVLSRSGKSLVIEPAIELDGAAMKYEGDHFVVKRYYKDVAGVPTTVTSGATYPDAAATWRLQDEYYMLNADLKDGSSFVPTTTTTPALPAGADQSVVIEEPVGYYTNKRTLSPGVVYDMQVNSYWAVNKLADLSDGAGGKMYDTYIRREGDTGTSSTNGIVELSYSGADNYIVTELVKQEVGFQGGDGTIYQIPIIAYKVWRGDRPADQISVAIDQSFERVSVDSRDSFGPKANSDTVIHNVKRPDAAINHASLKTDGVSTGGYRTSAAVGPVLTGGSLPNPFGPAGTYAFDKDGSALEIGASGVITSLGGASYSYSGSYDIVVPKTINLIGKLADRGIDLDTHQIYMTYNKSLNAYVSAHGNKLASIDYFGLALPSGYSKSRQFSLGPTNTPLTTFEAGSEIGAYAYFLPGATVVYDTDVIRIKKDVAVSVGINVVLENPFSNDILGLSSFPGKKTDGTYSTVFYFNNKTVVRGLRRFGPVAVLGSKTSGAATIGTQTLSAIGASHIVYTDPLADTSVPVNKQPNITWPGAYAATGPIGTYSAANDRTVWLYTDKNDGAGSYNGTGGTNGMGSASAYLATTDSQVMWMESVYSGIIFGTRLGEYILTNDQDALQFAVQKVGQTGSPRMMSFQGNTSCIYKGIVFFISNIGITSIAFSQEMNSYIPKNTSFYGRISGGEIASIISDELNNCIMILTRDTELGASNLWYWFPENDAVFETNQKSLLNMPGKIAHGLVKFMGEPKIVLANSLLSPTNFYMAGFSKKKRSSLGGYLRTTRFGMLDGRNSIVKQIFMTVIGSYGGKYRVLADDNDPQWDYTAFSVPVGYLSAPYFTGVMEIFSKDGSNSKSSGKRIEILAQPGEEIEISSIRAEVQV